MLYMYILIKDRVILIGYVYHYFDRLRVEVDSTIPAVVSFESLKALSLQYEVSQLGTCILFDMSAYYKRHAQLHMYCALLYLTLSLHYMGCMKVENFLLAELEKILSLVKINDDVQSYTMYIFVSVTQLIHVCIHCTCICIHCTCVYTLYMYICVFPS